MNVGIVGLGAMGLPMARNLHKAGLLRACYNRTPDKARTLAVETGCRVSATPQDLAGDCDAVVICVSADEDVLEVCDALSDGLDHGKLVLDCSTTSAETSRRAAELISSAKAGFLDCPVSGGTEGAVKGTLAIMVGGDSGEFARARPVLDALGKSVVHMGPVGAGQATKAVNQIMIAGINQAVTEALAFARAESLPLERVISVIGSGAAANWFLEHRGPTMVKESYTLGFKVELHKKDLEICRKMAARHDAQLPVVEMTLIHYRRLLEQGYENEDISSLFRLKAALFKKN